MIISAPINNNHMRIDITKIDEDKRITEPKNAEGRRLYYPDNALDVLAGVVGMSSDISEWESDREWEAHQYILEHYNWEAEYIRLRNEFPLDDFGDEFANQELQYGAFLALNHPEEFASRLEEWTADIKDKARDYDCREELPIDLRDELEEATSANGEACWKEFLYGDYRELGLLGEVEKFFYGLDYEVAVKHNSKDFTTELEFDLTQGLKDTIHEYLCACYDEGGCELGDYTEEQCGELFVDILVNRYIGAMDNKRSERERWAREAAEKREYQAKRLADEKVEREAKLKAMTK